MKTLGLLAEPGRYGLATDLYELTMAAAYFEAGMERVSATFNLFARHLPHNRGYLVVAGLVQAVEYLRKLSFDGDSIEHLTALPEFAAVSDRFWEYLRAFRFTGDVEALAEGTVAFANERGRAAPSHAEAQSGEGHVPGRETGVPEPEP